MKQIQSSKKSQEMHAEQLLKVSTSLLTAFIIAIFIIPMSTVVGASLRNDTSVAPMDAFTNLFGSWYGVIFVVAEVVILIIVLRSKRIALSIYDDLYPDEQIESDLNPTN